MNGASTASPADPQAVSVRGAIVRAKGARWTLVGSFETNGARYIVARETEATVGFDALTERERQALGCLALGQSTKETAHALGITDVTVRVLVARASTKLGVRTRKDLLAHEQVRALCPPK